MQRSMYCEGKAQQKLVNRIKRIRGQVDVIERSLSVGEADEDVLMLLANVRGGINSLLAATLKAHLRQVLLSERKDSAPFRELTGTLIDLVHVYFT
jgi:DNA-binding FrmR family transcriptional regulator